MRVIQYRPIFFDYDNDEDLDVYLVNHMIDTLNMALIVYEQQLPLKLRSETDKLFRNNGNGTFTNVSDYAGIINRAWGLSAAIGDFNEDGWNDVYVANDFIMPDFLYINNGDGTFTERLSDVMKHVSYYAMGSDYADINNDGLPDLFVVDMAYADHARSKRMMSPMNIKKFYNMVELGYHYQFMTNTLQLNNGKGSFSEIAQMAGVDKTEWSWAALITDMDNNGFKDLLVTNGIKYDAQDRDFNTWYDMMLMQEGGQNLSFEQVMERMPSARVKNIVFENNGDLTFGLSDSWSFSEAVNSNGAAFADFDLDGDLDLVMNNMDTVSYLYENRASDINANNYLRIKLNGNSNNKFGIGATVTITTGQTKQYQELFTVRGFLSSVEPILHFGLGSVKQADRLLVNWPDGKVTIVKNVKANQTIILDHSNATSGRSDPPRPKIMFREIAKDINVDFVHKENPYLDFDKEILLPHRQSQNGPYISVGDVNMDGLEDFFIGGAKSHPGQLFLQESNGHFKKSKGFPSEAEKAYEDLASLFFDVDGDGDQDLYIVSGGNEVDPNSDLLQDRLYLNDGTGNFQVAKERLPKMISSGQCVIGGDFDQDGDKDLFVGGRVVPGHYPTPPRSYLLENQDGFFADITQEKAPELLKPGMVTDALFTDYDNDTDLDLIVVGEWMPVSVFENKKGKFEKASNNGLQDSEGWWFSIIAGDFDSDGDTDYIVGNLGTNNKFKPTVKKPLHLYYNDFDKNGIFDIVLAKQHGEKCYPVRGRDCSSEQMPFIWDKFPTYKSFAEADIEKIYTRQELDLSLHLVAKKFESCLLVNEGGNFIFKPLPNEAQISPITSAVVMDLNQDSHWDVVVAGNFYGAEVETTRYDAGSGLCLLGDGQGRFTPLRSFISGLFCPGDVRNIQVIHTPDGGTNLLVANNSGPMQVFNVVQPTSSKLLSSLQ